MSDTNMNNGITKVYASQDWVKENTIPSPVEAVPVTNESAKVLVEENGVIKRVPKENVGVSGELLYSGEIQCSPAVVSVWGEEISGNCCELPFSIEKACDLVIVWDGTIYNDGIYFPRTCLEDGELYFEIGNDNYILYGEEPLEKYAPIGIFPVGDEGKFHLFAADTNPHIFSVYMLTDMSRSEYVTFDLTKYLIQRGVAETPEGIAELDYDSFVELAKYIKEHQPLLLNNHVQVLTGYANYSSDADICAISLSATNLGINNNQTMSFYRMLITVCGSAETRTTWVSEHKITELQWESTRTDENLLA